MFNNSIQNVIVQRTQPAQEQEQNIDQKKEIKFFWKSIPILMTFVVFILVYIWICKIVHYAKDEKKNRQKYIIENRLDYYEEGEFCKEKYNDFIKKGVYETFDIPIKKLKKWAIALIVLIPLFFIVSCISCLFQPIALFSCLDLILLLIFGILFASSFSDCNFEDFVEFSKCRYLNKQFRKDYDFIYKIKDGFQTPLIFLIIIEVTSCLASLADLDPSKM